MNKQPPRIEREFRFLILRPSESELAALPSPLRIEQIYLETQQQEDARRVRKTTLPSGASTYTLNAKKRLGAAQNLEWEEEISPERFAALAAHGTGIPIKKRRFVFDYHGVCFELDVYDELSSRHAVLEAETSLPRAALPFPPFLSLVKEITEDPAYSNAALSTGVLPPDFA